ncbi:MAG: type II secretion system F family protein [Planctomycetaceae bacterium]
MPDFQYTARQFSGQQVTGVIEASSQQEALAALAARELFPLQVSLAESAIAEKKHVGKRVKPRQLAIFYGQLSDLLHSGVPLLRSLELLERQSQSQSLQAVVKDVKEQVADGSRLYDAMRRHPKAFSELVISMIRAGEEGGFVEDVLKRVAAFTDHQEDLKGRVMGAMIYPVFLMVFGLIIVAVLMVKFVPKFQPVFDRMAEKDSLPWATTTLLTISNATQSYWPLFIIFTGAAVLGLLYWQQTESGKLKIDQFRLRAWGVGRIVRSLAIARFCRILGTLLHNGVPILQSLRIAKDATGNAVLSQAIAAATENISAGKSLAKPLAASGEFPPEMVEMVSVGEEANNLEKVLIDVADNLERRTNRELDVAVRMLEPLMLLVMAAIVLFVVIALLLPILQSSNLA